MAKIEDKKEYEIFSGKKLCDVFQNIYENSSTKKSQIMKLINELRTLIKSITDATIIVPLIAQYLEISVRNDEHLIKLAEIVQRLIKSDGKVGDGVSSIDDILSDDEKQQLLEKAVDYTDMIREKAKNEAIAMVKISEKQMKISEKK